MQQNKKSHSEKRSVYSYFAEFCDPNLRALLIDRDNIPPLEFLLESEGQQQQRLQKLEEEGKLDFGPKISRWNLGSLFHDVKDNVDSFLDISEIDTPKHEYFSLFRLNRPSLYTLFGYSLGGLLLFEAASWLGAGHLMGFFPAMMGSVVIKMARNLHRQVSQTGYRPKSKLISLSNKEKRRVILIPYIAHEYAHHIQAGKISGLESVLGINFSLFKEGHARGVQRNSSHLYREREDNEAFLYDITDITFGELKSTYLWICEHLGIQSRKSLTDKKSSRDRVEGQFRNKFKQPTPHAPGNTLFYLYETQMGSEIYKEMINGTFVFPNL